MKDEVEKQVREGFVACGLEGGVLDSMTAHYTKKLLALQVEAVRAELTKAIQADDNGTGCYEYIADRLARLNTEGDEWETEPLSPEEVLKVQEETDREIRSE